MPPVVRRAAVAGSWYPGSAAAIRAQIESYLALAPPPALSGRLVGIISPHAGLRYSGPVAAHGYALLRGQAELTVVVVGPSHREAFEGLAVFAQGAFETPLGRVPIDEELAHRVLSAEPLVRDLPGPHLSEHSLEMQLPFLQCLVPGLRIVPILMGRQGREDVEALAGALACALSERERVLLVGSSDLSHYHPAATANALDALVVDDVRRFDADGLMRRLAREPRHACGGGPMVAVMKAAGALGAHGALVLCYGDSGDAGEHDKGRVVGYLSAALVA
jgi:AmmeMemoRadiSam system protein B